MPASKQARVGTGSHSARAPTEWGGRPLPIRNLVASTEGRNCQLLLEYDSGYLVVLCFLLLFCFHEEFLGSIVAKGQIRQKVIG